MEFKYITKEFSAISCGDVFISTPESKYQCMKIKPIIDNGDRHITAIRLIDGEPMYFNDTDIVCPLNCIVTHNINK